MNGLTFEKILLVGVIAALIIGPERLPALAEGLAKLVKRARSFWKDNTEKLSEELDQDLSFEKLKEYDPRKYDPRKIIRQAWLEAEQEEKQEKFNETRLKLLSSAEQRNQAKISGIETPFDPEAT